MHASNLLKAVLKPRSLSSNSSKKSSLGDTKAKRSLSPDSRLPSSLAGKKSLSASSSPVKRTCMCSPTSHPGSFRCRFHRAQQQAAAAAMPPTARSRNSSTTLNSDKEHVVKDSNVLSEVNRTLPGRSRSISRSPPSRTSRLNRMTLGRDVDDVIATSTNDVRIRVLESDMRSSSSVTVEPSPAAPNVVVDFPREIPTIFCQSTSKKAMDVFDRNMTRMYL